MARHERRGWVAGWGRGTAWGWAMVGVVATGIGAQEPDRPRVRVFLDCPGFCDETHIRSELPWADWVRDRNDADVHLLVSDQATGSGGRRYTLDFIGREAFEGVDDQIVFATSGDATQDERREELVSAVALGLGRYVARTPGRSRVRVQAREGAGGPQGGPPGRPAADPPEDPWDYWVFNLGLSGNVSGESSFSSSSTSGSVSANRTTDLWKLNLSARFNRRENTFELTDTSVTSVVETWSTSGLLVRSLGPHWSLGVEGSAGKSTFNNEDFRWSASPGVEYNVFPYDESTRRQLTIQYLVGVTHWDYESETIYGVTEETRPNHSFNVNLNLIEPWGQSRIGFSAVQYLHDTAFYRVALFGGMNIRIFRGFSLRIDGSYSWVADQLYLAADDLSDEDILLQRQARATDHRYFTSFGISYRFGSIFNNVVNPRFGGGGGGVFFF